MIPFKGKAKVAKAYKTPNSPMPGYLKGKGSASADTGVGGVRGNRMPSDLTGEWQNVPFPSKNTK